MDLLEFKDHFDRHPWEIVRLDACVNILKDHMRAQSDLKAIDVGCGDGYAASRLAEGLPFTEVDALDIHLTADQLNIFNAKFSSVTFYNSAETLRNDYNLCVLMDVLEHLPDDSAFLAEVTEKRLGPSGMVFITVPAFQWLFGTHDVFVKHYRRYTRRQILALIARCGLEEIRCGYLFGSLLPVRFLSVVLERILRLKRKAEGSGGWRAPRLVKKIVIAFLRLDNWLMLSLSRMNLYLPGLTVWVLAKRKYNR